LLQLDLLFFDIRDHVTELIIESGLIHISLRRGVFEIHQAENVRIVLVERIHIDL